MTTERKDDDEYDRCEPCDRTEYPCYVKVRFNLWQRLRVLLGQRVFVVFPRELPGTSVSWVAPADWMPPIVHDLGVNRAIGYQTRPFFADQSKPRFEEKSE